MSSLSTIAWMSTRSRIACTSTLSTISWMSICWTTSSTSIALTTTGATSLATDCRIAFASSRSEPKSPERGGAEPWCGACHEPCVAANLWNASTMHSTSTSGSAIAVGSRPSPMSSRSSTPNPVMFISEPSRGPNGKLSSMVAPQMWRTPRMPGNDVATKSTELACDRIADTSTRARQTADRRRQHLRHVQRRLPTGSGQSLGNDSEQRTGMPVGDRDLHPGRHDRTTAARAVAPAGGRRESKFWTGDPETLVVQPETDRRTGNEQIVAAATERERRGPCAGHGECLESAAHRLRRRQRRQPTTGHHDLPGDRVGDVEAALDTTHDCVHGIDPHRRRHAAGDPVRDRMHGSGEIDGDAHRARLAPRARRRRRVDGVRRHRSAVGRLRRFTLVSGVGAGDDLIEHRTDERHAVRSVHQGMVGSQVQRRPTAFQTLDDGDIPRRHAGVERRWLEQRDEIEHLALIARRRDRRGADVVRRVEGRRRRPTPDASECPASPSGRWRSRPTCSAAMPSRSANAERVGARSSTIRFPTIIRSVASWPTPHMIEPTGLIRSDILASSQTGGRQPL